MAVTLSKKYQTVCITVESTDWGWAVSQALSFPIAEKDLENGYGVFSVEKAESDVIYVTLEFPECGIGDDAPAVNVSDYESPDGSHVGFRFNHKTHKWDRINEEEKEI